VADAKNTRLLPAVPVVDSVPLMVWRESKVTAVTPADAGPVTDKLLYVVFNPVLNGSVMDRVPAEVLVKDTL
jgi:hypothetical protein